MPSRKVASIILLILMLVPMLCSCPAWALESSDAVDFSGKRIGIFTGSIHDTIARENFKDPILSY